ncbi:2-deoxyribose-5-phosphate aldolase [Corynebacterium xerosis]|uniref:2-deoxyribose-5-phosphate aldolase n=1 Tax=Corynebacterium xerosis TaxID=1725 RepID=A0A6B8TNX8_9CORY|nr:2-deoxyribose-5-phosphate aldolase [Corynebacterium xerosis]QGS34706.1 2-deoxyribose-5-phosphate aldolase [Corynebacterium xerosis]
MSQPLPPNSEPAAASVPSAPSAPSASSVPSEPFAASRSAGAPVPASSVDAAILDPELTADEVRAAVAAAAETGCAGVRLHPPMLDQLGPGGGAAAGLRMGVVCGFPTGRSHILVKAAEARLAAERGAHDVAVVLDRAAVAAGDANAVLSEVVALRGAVTAPTQLTVVVETALHASGRIDDAAFGAIIGAVAAGGADAIATATGWHPDGVGGPEQIRRIAAAAGGGAMHAGIGIIAVIDGGGPGPADDDASAARAAEAVAAGAHVVQLRRFPG